ncbi:MAG: tetratricopeptide repeat protein, partial [Thermodesulfobacteriota bacterium]
MKKSILIIALLAISCSGCGGGSGIPANVKLAEGLDPSVETVENECAFFYFTWGRTAELDGKFEEAREAYEKALVCDLHAVHVMRRLALLLVNMEKKKEAASWIKRILEEDPDDSSSSAFLANLYVSMEQADKAEQVYLNILEKNPQDTDNMLLLGALYARQKKYAEAEKLLEQLIKLNPDSFIGHQYLAKVYMVTGKAEKARKAFNKALELNWTTFLAFEVATFLGGNGYESEALNLYREILEEDESNERIRTT